MFKQYKDTPYDIYDDGRCYSHLSHKFLTPKMSVKYPTYNLTINGKKQQKKVHRMVAETFVLNPENKPIVNHKDGNTHNFNFTNLEWVTLQENSLHAYENNLMKKGNQNINKFVENIPGEEWCDIKDYPSYMVSSFGRIINKRTKRLLKQYENNSGGYYCVNLWKENKGKTLTVHPLVYSNFNQDFDLKNFVINHKDGNKHNNNIQNLEKITYKSNNLHAAYVIKTNKSCKGVNQLDINKNIINSYPSIAEAQRQLNIYGISRAIKQNSKAGGYYWQFK